MTLRSAWVPRSGVLAISLSLLAFSGCRQAADLQILASSLVALPCQVQGDEEMAFLADAVPSTLTTLLGEAGTLETRLPPTSFQVDPARPNIARVAEAYGVETCLRCSVEARAERLTIRLELVDVPTAAVLWNGAFEGARDAYLDVVRDASEGLLAAVGRPSTPPPIPTEAVAIALAIDSDAEVALQRGRYYSNLYNNRRNPADAESAEAAFGQALELQPDLAQAAAELAFLYILRLESDLALETAVVEATQWGRRAIDLDVGSALGWGALSAAETNRPQGEWRKSLEYAFRAANLASDDGRVHNQLGLAVSVYSVLLTVDVHLAVDRLDPLYIYSRVNAAAGLEFMGRADEARPLIQSVLQIEPDLPAAVWVKAMVDAELAPYEAASMLATLDSLAADGRFVERYSWLTHHSVAWSLQDATRIEEYRTKILDWATDPATGANDMSFIHSAVPPLVRNGDLESALSILQSSVEVGTMPPYDWLGLHPDLGPVRESPRFAAILNGSRERFTEFLDAVELARSRNELPEYLEQPLQDLRASLGI